MCLPLVEEEFRLNVAQTGFITSSVLSGSCIGALSIGSLSDRFGRKKLLIVSAILFLLGSGLCAAATGFTMMVIARIILGLAVGAASALTPAYLTELAPKERRGSLSTLFQLMITFGILLAYASNLGFLGHNIAGIRDWRWMLGSALIPSALLLIGAICGAVAGAYYGVPEEIRSKAETFLDKPLLDALHGFERTILDVSETSKED